MRPEHPLRSRSRSPSSSFGKTSQDYPLAVFDPNENDSESSQFITVGRESSDSARPDQRETTNEPLLPTSTHHPRRIAPEPFSCTLSGIRAWIKGPPYPHRYQITPWLPRWQTAPGRLVERYFPSTRAKVWLLLGCICTWGVIFLSILHSSVAGQQVSGYGAPVKLSCHARLWPNSTDCGLNGDSCRPFDDGAFAFRCPASCADAMLLEPYFVGPEEYNYRPLVIGGTADGDITDAIYRGDSAICPAALHAGLIDSQKGGCGVLRRTGERTKFPSVTRNGIESIGYASYFPLSFTFGGESSETSCQDLRWPLFTFSVIVTTLLSLFITSPAAFYASIYFIVYFQVALSSDPPYSPDYYEVVSTALGRFLPCAFVGFAMYYFCVRKTLTDLSAHWDKTVLWLGSCWVGALNTDTFDKIPISRLTPHDIQQQPGAIPALIIIIGLLVAIVLTQAIAFRREGRMPKMLLLYGIMVCGVIALMLVPHMNLRIHHYVLSLLFLPGTTLQTRPSLLYQGLLIGLFINGIARWGFDSILQTSAALLDGAQLGSVLPVFGAPAILSSQNIMFNFNDVDKDADGISVLVNDVERFRAFKSDDGMLESFNWTRHLDGELEYFRFGYIKVNALGGIWYEDFTRPGTWESEGEWVPPDADSVDDSGSVSPSLA